MASPISNFSNNSELSNGVFVHQKAKYSEERNLPYQSTFSGTGTLVYPQFTSSIEFVGNVNSITTYPNYIDLSLSNKIRSSRNPLNSPLLEYLHKISILTADIDDDQNYENPNNLAISKARRLIQIVSEQSVAINRITKSIEGGVCLVFLNSSARMYFEVYNDGEMGYISENILTRKKIDNRDVKSISIAEKLIKKFITDSK